MSESASWHLPPLGAVLTVLVQEDTEVIVVMVEGLSKGEQHRY